MGSEPLIAYWDHILSALLTLDVGTRTTLIQKNWPQSQLTIVESNAMFFNNGLRCLWLWRVCSGRWALYWPCAQSSGTVVLCFLLIAMKVIIWSSYVQEMRTPSQSSWWKHCLHPILFELAPVFVKMKWNIAVQAPKTRMCSAPIWVGTPKKVSSGQWTQRTN